MLNRIRLASLIGLLALALGLGSALVPPLAAQQGELPSPDRSLLSTGQTQGFRGNVALEADGNRDDGDLIRGRAFDFEVSDVVTPTTQAENLVVDRNTGLMWVRNLRLLDANDEVGVRANYRLHAGRIWPQAIEIAQGFRYAGHEDWRLPNVAELQTIVDFGRWSPALDPVAFPEPMLDLPSAYFWTSTTSPFRAGDAYYINMLDGHAWLWEKMALFGVRPVRTALTEDRVAVMRTGQTKRYLGLRETVVPGFGDDGDLRKGLQQDYDWSDDGRIDTAAENRLVDRNTGLLWLRDTGLIDGTGAVGANVDLSEPIDWQTAVERCNGLEYAGRDDWRLPNIRELDSLSQLGREDSAFDPEAFPNLPVPPDGTTQPPWIWWSSTTNVRDRQEVPPQDEAWYLSASPPVKRHHVFHLPDTPKAQPGHVRCVADAEPVEAPEAWRAQIRSSKDWRAMSIDSAQVEIDRVGKFLLPVEGEDAAFDSAFQDVSRYLLHLDFLRQEFPDRFGAMTAAEYEAMVGRRAGRRYFAGGLREFQTVEGVRVYGFDLYVDNRVSAELLDEHETLALHARIGRVFRRRPLVYAPVQPEAVAAAGDWRGSRLPVAFPASPPALDYEAYTTGDAYGRVRLLDLEALKGAGGAGLSWQDILVLDRSPTDVEAVLAGIVTGGRQGDLSHLNVRAARRGTPNVFVADAHAAFRDHEGQLVRMTVTREGYVVNPDVSLGEAEAHWAAIRPPAVVIPAYDPDPSAIEDLARIAASERSGDAVSRVGAKAANLARLYRILPKANQVPGLALPFHYYHRYMADTSILDDRQDPVVSRSLADYVVALHEDPRFLSEPAFRAERLSGLRARIREAAIPDSWEADIEARLSEVFGPATMVRFRSSSNAEDGLVFNGAGLYDSTSVCAEDGSDGDKEGPSRCDADQAEERTIKRGLRKVWASLWSYRAWEERAWYGIDPMEVGMALLVTPSFPEERANGVAFTGNPLAPESSGYLVNVQAGDLSVVLPESGVLPERDLIEVGEGRVTGIRRLRASSEVPAGAQVMSDAELQALGELLILADANYPVDPGGFDRKAIMLDLEFKIDGPDDALLIKQIRPFLPPVEASGGRAGFLRLSAPEPLALCSGWRLPYPISEEHAERIELALPAGEWTLPIDLEEQSQAVFDALRFGPDRRLARAMDDGSLSFSTPVGRPEIRRADLRRRYDWQGRAITVSLSLPGLFAGEANLRQLGAADLTRRLQITAQIEGRATQVLTPCGLPLRPETRLEVTLEGDQHLRLRLRYAEPPGFAPVTQAQLVGASVQLTSGRIEIYALERLAYDADRHNWNERFWMRFEAPVDGAWGLALEQRGIAGQPGQVWTAGLLNADLLPLRALEVISVSRFDLGPEGRQLYLPSLQN